MSTVATQQPSNIRRRSLSRVGRYRSRDLFASQARREGRTREAVEREARARLYQPRGAATAAAGGAVEGRRQRPKSALTPQLETLWTKNREADAAIARLAAHARHSMGVWEAERATRDEVLARSSQARLEASRLRRSGGARSAPPGNAYGVRPGERAAGSRAEGGAAAHAAVCEGDEEEGDEDDDDEDAWEGVPRVGARSPLERARPRSPFMAVMSADRAYERTLSAMTSSPYASPEMPPQRARSAATFERRAPGDVALARQPRALEADGTLISRAARQECERARALLDASGARVASGALESALVPPFDAVEPLAGRKTPLPRPWSSLASHPYGLDGTGASASKKKKKKKGGKKKGGKGKKKKK